MLNSNNLSVYCMAHLLFGTISRFDTNVVNFVANCSRYTDTSSLSDDRLTQGSPRVSTCRWTGRHRLNICLICRTLWAHYSVQWIQTKLWLMLFQYSIEMNTHGLGHWLWGTHFPEVVSLIVPVMHWHDATSWRAKQWIWCRFWHV